MRLIERIKAKTRMYNWNSDVQTCCLFYLLVFRNTILGSKGETVKVCNFVTRLPAYILDMQASFK